MKKLGMIIIFALSFLMAGCSGFWEWVEEEDDRRNVYSFDTGVIEESEYKALFVDRRGKNILINGFCPLEDVKAGITEERLLRKSDSSDLLIAARWSDIEEKLITFGYSSSVINRIEYRAKGDKKVI